MGFDPRLCSPLLTLALVMGLSTPAHADEPDPGTRVAARELAVSGAEAFDKQDYATALDRFQRAESLYKVPSIAVMVARCLSRLGRLVEAVDKYEETLRMPLGAGSPEAFQRAVADATTEVEQARARVARLELRPPSDTPEGLQIMLDGKLVPRALWSVPKPVDPGVHRVTARAAGRAPYRYEVSLAEGSQRVLELSLLEAHAGPPHAGAPTSATSETARPVSRLGIVLLAGGGVALAVGTVTGIVALNHHAKLETGCQPGCPESLREDLDGFRLNRTLSYVGFGVGLAAAGAGAYFVLHQSPSGERIDAKISPNGAVLTGRF